MRTRISRVEQVARNRALVLAAARRVFLARGYAGATLEAIAEEAGFSKGVVYSQFDSKADLFLELLAARIAERAEQHERLALELGGARLVQAVAELNDNIHQAEPQWSLLVIEFRVHAARVPELNRRYALLHAQTVERLAGFFAGLHERNGTLPQYPPRVLAELILTIGSGVALERIADPGAVPRDVFAQIVHQIAALPAGHAAPAREPACARDPATAEPATGAPATGAILGT
jgi:AcrR family transcriptional regulator